MGKINKIEFTKAVNNSAGNKTLIARRLGVSWVGLWKYLNKYPELNELIKHEQYKLMDLAQSKLVNKVNNGEDWAIRFVLTNQGGMYGWFEKPQIQVIDKQNNVQVNIASNIHELIEQTKNKSWVSQNQILNSLNE